MTALPNKPYIFVEATEKLAYSTLIKNQAQIALNFSNKGLVLKDLDELRRISCLGLLLNIPNPSEKTNELYKLVIGEWEYFKELGTIKDFTPNLSYRSILYILRLYNYNLSTINNTNTPMSIAPIQITKTPQFNFTEEESLELLMLNQKKLEASMHFKASVTDIVKPKFLAEVLRLPIADTKNNIYNFLKENWEVLTTIGCVKKGSFNLSYRGIVYLLQKKNYPLYTKSELTAASPTVQTPPVTLMLVKPVEVNETIVKPDISLITSYIKSERAKLKLIADRDNAKAKDSMTKLNMVETALLLAEDAANLLIEAGV